MSDDEKHEKKRLMILNEIVSSEETYLNRLEITRDLFIIPIQERNLLSKAERDGQFGELEAIVDLHMDLSRRLTTAHADGVLEVGQVFSEICPEFGIYKGYLKCFEKALVKRGKLLTSNRKFAEYLVEAKADPRCQGFSMESLLIEPVQRIPRYRLLLEDLLKSTPESHTDFNSIKNALESICTIAAENNEAIRQQEELDKVYQVMQQMEYNGSVNLLDNEDRKFLKQDDLFRQCRRGRKSFRFWLFNDKLLYGEPSKPILGKFNLNRDIPLSDCKVSSIDENDEFVMRFESPSKSFIVWFQDRTLRDDWVTEIVKCVEQCRGKDVESQIYAPVWNPDAASSQCAICKTDFSFINRRHHCRNCGCIVCDGCSRSRVLLNHVDQNAPVRVCNKCRDGFLIKGETSADRARRHTADINMNSLFPNSKSEAHLTSKEDVKTWQDKHLLRSQSSDPGFASPIAPAKEFSRSKSGFVPKMPKPTDKAPTPPPVPPSTGIFTQAGTNEPPATPPKPSNTSNPSKVQIEPSHTHIVPPPPPPRPPPPPAPKPSASSTVVKDPPEVIKSVPTKPIPEDKPPPPPSVSTSIQVDATVISSTDDISATSQSPPVPPKPVKPTKPDKAQPCTRREATSDTFLTKPDAPPPPPTIVSAIGATKAWASNSDSSTETGNDEAFSQLYLPIDELRHLNSQHRVSLLARNGIENFTSKEMYLSDEDFLKHVGCDKQTFNRWPAWKKTNKRKELGLF